RLSELLGIQANEQPSGAVNISVGGDLLVFEGQRREVAIDKTNQNGIASGIVKFADTNGKLQTATGEVAGLYAARDQIVGGFMSKLNDLAGTLAFEFNKVYSQGQGNNGFQNLTSVETIKNANAALDSAGLKFTPVSGAFNVIVQNKDGDTSHTTSIRVDLDG